MKKLAVAMMGLILCGQAVGADWVSVDDDIEIDMESIQKRYVYNKPYVGVWTRATNNGRPIAQNLRWYQCKDNTMSSLPSSSMVFDRRGQIKPNETQQRQLGNLQFVDIPPDTIPEFVYDIACSTSLMQEVYSIQDFKQSDMARLQREYGERHFATFNTYLSQKQGD